MALLCSSQACPPRPRAPAWGPPAHWTASPSGRLPCRTDRTEALLGRPLGLSGPFPRRETGGGGWPESTVRAQSPGSSSSPEALGSLKRPLGRNLSLRFLPGGPEPVWGDEKTRPRRGLLSGPEPAQGPRPAAPSSRQQGRPTGCREGAAHQSRPACRTPTAPKHTATSCGHRFKVTQLPGRPGAQCVFQPGGCSQPCSHHPAAGPSCGIRAFGGPWGGQRPSRPRPSALWLRQEGWAKGPAAKRTGAQLPLRKKRGSEEPGDRGCGCQRGKGCLGA